MPELERALRQEQDRLSLLMDLARNDAKKAPEGSLRIASRGSHAEYYHRKSRSDRGGRYIPVAERDTAKAIAQRDYAKSFLQQAEAEKTAIDNLLRVRVGEADGRAILDLFENLHEFRKELITPLCVSDDEYASQWSEVEFQGKGFDPDTETSFFTEKNERVRSKSEVIIANRLSSQGVSYRYEFPLQIEGFRTIFPDFIVLNKRTRAEYLWEHFGMMDDESYCGRALRKLNMYERNGFFPGKNLLVTFETRDLPLDTQIVDSIIEEFLL